MRLHRAGWISPEDAQRIALCWWFGRLIGNSDMHFGNLALYLGAHLPLTLAPIYDMLPMHYRPNAGGGIQGQPHTPPPPMPEHHDTWRQACRLARSFWTQLQTVPDLSTAFREIAARQQDTLATLYQRFA